MKKLLIILVLINISICLFYSKKENNTVVYQTTIIKEIEVEIDTLSEKAAIKYMAEINIKFPDIVRAQCILEGGNFESNIAKTNNNFLGMKHPRQRPTLSKGSKNGYARYQRWQDCLADYVIWQSLYARNCKTELDYLDLLSRIYASDKNYKEKIIRLIHEFRKEKQD